MENVSFTVRAGQTLAILGESGRGKSTLLNLIARLHQPTSGCILIDGRDIRDYRVDSLRRRLGIVLQENLLFAGSVRDNIALGLPTATDEQVEAAARLANAHHFIVELTEGYDTLVGERGATLSQGQRQRIAIARAAIRGASLLLFDEPTTGLDEANERGVIEGLQNLSRGHTALWVTHNPRHAELADVVVRIEGGRVVAVERGVHAASPSTPNEAVTLTPSAEDSSTVKRAEARAPVASQPPRSSSTEEHHAVAS